MLRDRGASLAIIEKRKLARDFPLYDRVEGIVFDGDSELKHHAREGGMSEERNTSAFTELGSCSPKISRLEIMFAEEVFVM